MMMRYVIRPEDGAGHWSLGGKAGALAALRSAGLPIPAWFVVSPEAFDASLTRAQRQSLHEAAAAGNADAVAVALEDVRLSAEVAGELARALATLCPNGELVAVRSSALDEDGVQHSFAGQLETFLTVPPAEVAARVADVWRSGFAARTLAYRRERGLAGRPSAPAVLVQRMLRPQVSGVAFSADPVSGRRGVAVVSAVYGLGTLLVSGEANADTYTVARDGSILSRRIAAKSTAHHPAPARGEDHDEGVRTVAVEPVRAMAPALDDEQIRAVAALVRACERHFGLPQDIEWAIDDSSLYLLQSRPITSLAGMPDPDGTYTLWDNSNIAESYGGVTTPMTYSFARRAYDGVYRQLCRVVGIPQATIAAHDDAFRRMIGLVRGRIYYNLLSWYELLALAPGFASNRAFMEQMMGVKEGLPDALAARVAAVGWQGRLADRLRLARTVVGLAASYRRLPRSIERFYARVDAALALPDDALATMRPDELAAAYRDLERRLLTAWDAPLVNDLFAMVFYGTLRRLVVSWCGDTAGTLQNELLRDAGEIVSAEPARRVREMAFLAANSPVLVAALATGTLDAIQRAMTDVPAFAAAYEAYLAMFADRCLEELKLESPTLRDDPLPLLRSIGYLAQTAGAACCTPTMPLHMRQDMRQDMRDVRSESAQADFVAAGHPEPSVAHSFAGPMGEAGRGRSRLRPYDVPPAVAGHRGTDALAALARHPLRRLVFGWVLANARARVRDRENLRFERTRVFGRVRRILVELGRRLHALGLLADPRDIFYLELEEALGFVEGTATTADLRGLVALRQAEFARYRTMEPPPDRFETRGVVGIASTHLGTATRAVHAHLHDPADPRASEQRKGVGCCPGVVRGHVRVVRDPKEAQLRPGEILVAERTDPGWILLFAAAAGVLVERGSLLSHSAIVARELSIPTVVALGGATRWLHDGDAIELDGGSGIVRKLAGPHAVAIPAGGPSASAEEARYAEPV